MPSVAPRSAAVGPLFCIVHPGVAVTHVITAGPAVIALCGACVTELADQLSTIRLFTVSTARNSWRPPVAAR